MPILADTGAADSVMDWLNASEHVESANLTTNYDDEPVYVTVRMAVDTTKPLAAFKEEFGLRIGMARIEDGQLVVTLGVA